MTSGTSGLPGTPDGVTRLMDGLTFADAPVAPDDVPPFPADEENTLDLATSTHPGGQGAAS